MYILEPYDVALRHILDCGVRKTNRTGIDTLSIFGYQSRYDISKYFPVLTGRRVYPKSIIAELLWIISGSTNVKDLQTMGSHIWDEWDDPVFQQEKGYVEGSLGPVYGFSLRNYGGYYGNGDIEYGKGGFDQLQYMIDELKNNPNSRRNLFNLWNPAVIKDQRLPPCHYSFQVYVHEDKLSGMLTQRSADAYLGVPANTLEYSALIYMLAQQTGFQPGEFIHSIADLHLYVPHIGAAKEYLNRPKPDSPTLKLKKAPDIFSYTIDDFLLTNYKPLSPIKVEVMV